MAAELDVAVACPVCAGATRSLYNGLYDDRYGYPDIFTLYECDACGHFHIPNRFQPEDLGRLYTDYYPRSNFDVESFQPDRETSGFKAWINGDMGSAFRYVPRNVKVLDIGCGIGTKLAYHKVRGCEAVGIEADENVQTNARRHGLDIRQGVFDGTQFESEYFDYVTLDQVAEHVVDPHVLIRGIARVLKPGGTAIITTPNARGLGARIFGRKWLNWHVPYHIQFYTPQSLDLLARKAGLMSVSAKTMTASEWQYYQWVHIMQFPERGKRSAFWSPGAVEYRTHAGWDRLIDNARRYRLHRWVSRILDFAGVGDNYVFILRKP